jgi:hypothetical protein
VRVARPRRVDRSIRLHGRHVDRIDHVTWQLKENFHADAGKRAVIRIDDLLACPRWKYIPARFRVQISNLLEPVTVPQQLELLRARHGEGGLRHP